MRDIKGNRKPGASLPKQPRPRFTGSKVPLTKITTSDTPPPPTKKPSLKPHAPAPRLSSREHIVGIVLFVLAVVVAGLAALIFLPRADVTLILRTAPLLVDQEITLSGSTPDTPVPATAYFREVTVEGEAPVASTETVGTRASGTVQLVNRTFDAQQIKVDSRLVTDDGTLFYLQEAVTIPAAEGSSLGTVSARVEAAEAGAEGNIAAQRLDFAALDEDSQQLVYAQASTALSGGSGEVIAVVQEEDLAQARAHAGETARGQVETDIRDQVPTSWGLLEESWTADIQEFTTDVAVGDNESVIPYQARITLRVLGYETSALEAHLQKALTARLDENHMLFPGPISYSKTVKDINWDSAQAELAVRVTHTTIPQFSLETLKDKIAGRSEAETRQYLEGLPGVRSVSMELSPFWVHSIPRIEGRVNITLEPERQL